MPLEHQRAIIAHAPQSTSSTSTCFAVTALRHSPAHEAIEITVKHIVRRGRRDPGAKIFTS